MAKHSVSKSLKSFISLAEKKVTDAYTAKLRKHATDMGWPPEIVSQIKISYDGKSHKITYPEGLESQIKLLEYGDTNSFMKPALRSFMISRDMPFMMSGVK